jgi:hypothetical protein
MTKFKDKMAKFNDNMANFEVLQLMNKIKNVSILIFISVILEIETLFKLEKIDFFDLS